jgi:ferrochelatase
VKTAVVLFNLGGPDSLDAVAPFLRNLFSDPAIIRVPQPFRWLIANLISRRRAPFAQTIYAQIGGRSPILEETEAQGRALEAALAGEGVTARCFIAMRYWHPFAAETARKIKAFAPDRIVLLPLYPQFSTTTTQSSFADWDKVAKQNGLQARTHRVCCYPSDIGFSDAVTTLVTEALAKRRPGLSYRILFSAHGLPKRIVDSGDPYPHHVSQSIGSVIARLNETLDHTVCYQSRVGPLEWIGPATEAEIARAGKEGKGVIVVPIAFVSEHSETLVELDIDYANRAAQDGVPDYIRVSTVRTRPEFISGLARLVIRAAASSHAVTSADTRICPKDRICAYGT